MQDNFFFREKRNYLENLKIFTVFPARDVWKKKGRSKKQSVALII